MQRKSAVSDYTLASQYSQEGVKDDKSLQIYKKKLLTYVVFLFIVIFLFIFERIFCDQILGSEANIIQKLQNQWQLVYYSLPTNNYVTFIKNGFLKFIGSLDIFEFSFMLQTHYFISSYVSLNAFITVKIMYLGFIGEYFIGIIQLCYGAPRPYWLTSKASSPVCMQHYGHPSRNVFMFLFILVYTFHCYKNYRTKFTKLSPRRYTQILQLIQYSVLGGGLIYFFLQYIIGELFLCSFFMSVILFMIAYSITIGLSSSIDDLMKKSTINYFESKKKVFYWMIWIIIAIIFNLLVYSGHSVYLPSKWVQNYIYCKEGKGKIPTSTPFDEMLGSWYSMESTSVLYPLLSALFAVSYCFHKLDDNYWFRGTRKQKLIRVAIVNSLLIPSWLIVIFQQSIEDSQLMRFIGINGYLLNAFHFFILYFCIFGFVPVYIFPRFRLIHVHVKQQQNPPATNQTKPQDQSKKEDGLLEPLNLQKQSSSSKVEEQQISLQENQKPLQGSEVENQEQTQEDNKQIYKILVNEAAEPQPQLLQEKQKTE